MCVHRPVRVASAILLTAGALTASAPAAWGHDAAAAGTRSASRFTSSSPVAGPGLGTAAARARETELRRTETRGLGAEHAAEHAAQRAGLRAW
ncbi:hypothetical protein, partial [Patulibacter sp.]|uniref:hypothetical protein n=1 Tax=Patulibacter sp. TaxID=1912859 RepID=UPI0027293B68